MVEKTPSEPRKVSDEEFDKIVKLVNLGEDSFVIIKLREQIPEDTRIVETGVFVDIDRGGGAVCRRTYCADYSYSTR